MGAAVVGAGRVEAGGGTTGFDVAGTGTAVLDGDGFTTGDVVGDGFAVEGSGTGGTAQAAGATLGCGALPTPYPSAKDHPSYSPNFTERLPPPWLE